MRNAAVALLVLGLSLTLGCSSDRTMIFPRPPKHYEALGHVEGTATGSLGILATGYYFIPMGLNGRTERANAEALMKMPKATGLTNVTIQESWYWWVIGTARRVTVTGDANQEVRP